MSIQVCDRCGCRWGGLIDPNFPTPAECPFCHEVDDVYPGRCPDCFVLVEGRASVRCPKCLEKARLALAELESRGVGGQSCTPEMEDRMTPCPVGGSHTQNEETRRMYSGARNGRVTRKGEIYGG